MLRMREDWELVEAQTLAPYAMHSCHSRGRRFPEPPHPMPAQSHSPLTRCLRFAG
jgi:hypothetical protein